MFSAIPDLYLLLHLWVALTRHDNRNVCSMTNDPGGMTAPGSEPLSWSHKLPLEALTWFPISTDGRMSVFLGSWMFWGDFEKAVDSPPRPPATHRCLGTSMHSCDSIWLARLFPGLTPDLNELSLACGEAERGCNLVEGL